MIISLFMEPLHCRAATADVRAPARTISRRARTADSCDRTHAEEHVHHVTETAGTPQFVNRLIRTLRMRPNAASVAMSDDPP